MDDYEQLVLLTLTLKVPSFWENDLSKEFPKASFTIHDGNISSNKTFQGLLKIDGGNISKIQKFLDNYSNVYLDNFHPNSGIYFYEENNSFLAKSICGKKCKFRWPVSFHPEFKKTKIIIKRKFVNDLLEEIEKKKIEIVNLSIINVDFDFSGFLTPKQKDILEPCLKYGYYQFPKKISLNGLSEKIGISPSTLCVHLQKIESKVFNSDHSELFFRNPSTI